MGGDENVMENYGRNCWNRCFFDKFDQEKLKQLLHGTELSTTKNNKNCEYWRGVLVFQCLNGCLRFAKEKCRGFSCVFLVSNGPMSKKSS